MINSPSNPTGVVYRPGSELEALADAVLTTNVGVLSDEIYEQLTYGDARSRPASPLSGRALSRSDRSRSRA